MKNRILQRALDNEKRMGKGIWNFIEHEIGPNIHLGVADKYLIISQLRNDNDRCWKDLVKGYRDTLNKFNYHSRNLDEGQKYDRKKEKHMAWRATHGEPWLIG